MKELILDTSNTICSVAILKDDKLIAESHNEGIKQHSVVLMPMIKETLKENDLDLNDIDALGCGIGPGSFTGVRIAIATVKAFSDAKNIPIVGVNSLEAQAYEVIRIKGKDNCKILSLIDAKNENAYMAVYRVNKNKISTYKNPEIVRLSNIDEYFNFQETLYIVGDIEKKKIEPILQAKLEREKAQAKNTEEYEYVKISNSLSNAIGIATFDKYNKGLAGNSNSISPMYLQKPQAERQKDGDDTLYINEISRSDIEEIKENYEDFPNIWDYDTFYEDTKNSKYIVAKYNNEIVGFIGVKTVFDEIEIMNIVTKANKRKRGIGSSLLSYVIRKIPAEKINLEVNEKNSIAKNLYLKFGFEKVGTRKKYYNNTDDAILMSL